MVIKIFNKKLVLVIFIFTTLFFAGNVEGALTTNLLSYWSFDSDASDIYGSNEGSVSGATYGTTGCQLGGGCYSFGGDGDYISTSGSNLAITGAMSVSLWVKPTDRSTWQGLFIRNNLENSYSYLFAISDQGATDNYAYYNTNNNWEVFTDFAVTYGSWQHVVWTFDGSNMIVYKNGVASASQAVTAPPSNSSHSNYISGTWAPPNAFWVQGTVDEVAVWNKALSSAEVSSLYNSGSGMNPLCGAGQYLSSDTCTNVGAGYYSPANDPDRYQCAAGYYGSTTTNSVSTCNGACSAGYYCTAGSTSATQNLCSAGYYGSSTAQTAATCNGQCTAGYYCTAGSTSATQNVCGAGKYCPTGSSGTTNCAAGYYGSSTTNSVSTCNGACTAGYYCPAGSTSTTQNACGANNYCPATSGSATACTANSGSGGRTTQSAATDCNCDGGYYDADAGSQSCSVVGTGYYSASDSDSRTQCSAGYYGSTTTNSAATCNGACTAGYYCTAGSTSATQNVCGAGKYCLSASTGTTNCSAGYYCSNTTNAYAVGNGVCGTGKYCPAGSSGTTNCDAGYYGSSTTNSVSTCNGACYGGYYCAAGSTSASQNACGSGNYCAPASTGTTACTANSGTANTTAGVATDCDCNTDYYDSNGGTQDCSAVGSGYYSVSLSDSRTTCSNKPLNADYNSSGGGVNNCGFSCTGELEPKFGCATSGNNTNIHFFNNVVNYSNLTVKVGSKIYLNNSNVTISQLIMDGSGDKIIINSGSYLIINRSN